MKVYLLVSVLLIVEWATATIPKLERPPGLSSWKLRDRSRRSAPTAPASQWRTLSPPFNASVLTWRINKYSNRSRLHKADLARVIRRAMDAWSDVTPLDFQQISSGSDTIADIEIRFLDTNYDDIWGRTMRGLAHRLTIPNNPVRIHFNGDVDWIIGENTAHDDDRYKDLFTVTLHEIGHVLGLRHTDDPNSIMFYQYVGRKTELSHHDINLITRLYGTRKKTSSVDFSAPDHDGSLPVIGTFESSDVDCKLVNVCVPLPVMPRTNVRLHPECIELPQCVGGCRTYIDHCHATAADQAIVKYKSWRLVIEPALVYDYIGESSVHMGRHKACGCKSCPNLQEACNSKQQKINCQCVCKDFNERANCMAKGSDYRWSDYTCACDCVKRCAQHQQLHRAHCRCYEITRTPGL